MFDQVDANRDGRITWEETWTFVQARFAAADRDGNGGLSQQEMQDAMQAMWAAHRSGPRPDGTPGPRPDGQQGPRRADAPDRAEMLGAMFRALDADRNGQVTLVEIRPAVEARFRALDANMDSVVERSEIAQHGHRGPRGRGGPGGPQGAPPANPG
ncbi:MAG: EF-hand domain-containing protein [Acetobacteraceae bacterium]|nr:EF-hand domain-containing protein [Acetobacteraceae bacterium]